MKTTVLVLLLFALGCGYEATEEQTTACSNMCKEFKLNYYAYVDDNGSLKCRCTVPRGDVR